MQLHFRWIHPITVTKILKSISKWNVVTTYLYVRTYMSLHWVHGSTWYEYWIWYKKFVFNDEKYEWNDALQCPLWKHVVNLIYWKRISSQILLLAHYLPTQCIILILCWSILIKFSVKTNDVTIVAFFDKYIDDV